MSIFFAILLSAQLQFTYYFYAAKQAIEQQQYGRALMTFRFCEQLNPTDGTTKEYLGLIHDALGNEEEARGYFAKAYALNPYDLWKQYSLFLIRTGEDIDRRKALQILRRAGAEHPKDEDAWEMLYKADMLLGEHKKALKDQDHLDSLRGYDVYSAYGRYEIYRAMNKPKLALKEVERYLSLEPRDLNFQILRVQLYERLGVKWSKLEEGYRTVLAMDPGNILMLNNYAYGITLYGGDLKQAERMSQQTVREEPDNPIYLDTYAWILHLQGQDTLAAIYIKRAMENIGDLDDQEIRKHYKKIVR